MLTPVNFDLIQQLKYMWLNGQRREKCVVTLVHVFPAPRVLETKPSFTLNLLSFLVYHIALFNIPPSLYEVPPAINPKSSSAYIPITEPHVR